MTPPRAWLLPAPPETPGTGIWKAENNHSAEMEGAVEYVPLQCCTCGKKGLSTAEDGGPECELWDGRWVCSDNCWEIAANPALKGDTP